MILREKPIVKNNFFGSFPKKLSAGVSQKFGFGFAFKNSPGVWILWIYDPLLHNTQRNAKSVFWIQKSGFAFYRQKKMKKGTQIPFLHSRHTVV